MADTTIEDVVVGDDHTTDHWTALRVMMLYDFTP